MTYPTHKQYAVSFACVAMILLYEYGLTNIDYFLALPIVILVSKFGGLFPDVDHTWQNVKDKTVPNYIINKIIHFTGGKHRSWQTHSIDILVILAVGSFFIANKIYPTDNVNDLINREVLFIILAGFFAGWTSHLLADAMTSAGVRLFCWSKKINIRLVPKSIGKLKFNTGHEWEDFVYASVKKINIVLGIVCIVYPFIPMVINFGKTLEIF